MNINPSTLSDEDYEEFALTTKESRRAKKKQKLLKVVSSTDDQLSVPEDNIKKLEPKNDKQKLLLDYLESKDCVLAIGSAGTGKTFVCAAFAAIQFQTQKVNKIILVRPNQSCSKSLGAVPGTLYEKFLMWVQPFVSVFRTFMGKFALDVALKNEAIILQPLENIRGMSFDNALILIDECQNLTKDELSAIMTRVGKNTKVIFSGDTRQSDIKDSGLSWFVNVIKNNKPLNDMCGVVEFTPEDVVRSKLCKVWLQAIEK